MTLVELFAWMTDLLLYRVNQVPDKMYIKFLDMIGVQLEPPRAARAPVTFYLSAAQPADVTIPEGTEVATVRTETSPAIIFTTDADLTIRTAGVQAAPHARLRRRRRSAPGSHTICASSNCRARRYRCSRIRRPSAARSTWASSATTRSTCMAVVVECELAGGAGIDPNNPPTEWQVWQGGLTRWATCEVEYDGTGGFNQPGEIILHLPTMAEGEFQGVRGYWLRCRLTEAQSGPGAYRDLAGDRAAGGRGARRHGRRAPRDDGATTRALGRVRRIGGAGVPAAAFAAALARYRARHADRRAAGQRR